MDTPTEPAPPPQVRPVQGCQRSSCTVPATHHWQRRLTSGEQDYERLMEEGARADPERPFLQLAPMPDFGTYTYLVYACGDHVLTPDSMASIHQVDCAGPNSPHLPECTCTAALPPVVDSSG